MKSFEEYIILREFAPMQPQPQNGNIGGPQSGLAGPAHNADEDQMDLPSLIERRLQMLLDEIEKKRRMPKQQQMQILKQIIEKLTGMSGGLNNQQVMQTARGQIQSQDQMQPPMQQPQVGQ